MDLFLFIKGFFMGIAGLIPGISAGTIAFITGIYERFIEAISNVNLELIKNFFKLFKGETKPFKESIKKLDLVFLITIFAGLFTAIFVGSFGISFLLENYQVYTISFFIGLILASSIIVFQNIKNHSFYNILFLLLGLFLGVYVALLTPLNLIPSLLFVFIGAIIAVSAMFLPGLSGSFILFILGLYDYILNAVKTLNFKVLLVFILGDIIGALFISKLVNFLFKKDKCKVLYLLLGLILGGLVMPVKKILLVPNFSILFVILFVIIGFVIVLLFSKYNNK